MPSGLQDQDMRTRPSCKPFTDDLAFDRLKHSLIGAWHFPNFLFARRYSMAGRLSLALLSMVFVYGLSIAVMPGPALAAGVNCDVNACTSACTKKCATSGCGCASWCLQAIDARKKSGQCK